MGDHEYNDTNGGAIGIINQYLKPLNLTKTYYSFDMKNVHIIVHRSLILIIISSSSQYQFIEQDLRNASNNQKINWMFVVESCSHLYFTFRSSCELYYQRYISSSF